MSNASSQGRSTKSSDPRPSRRRVSSQPRRMDGRLTRVRWWTAAGIFPDLGRMRVLRERPRRDDPAFFDIDLERPPVARRHLRPPFGSVSHRGLRAIHFPCPAQVYAAIGAIGGFFLRNAAGADRDQPVCRLACRAFPMSCIARAKVGFASRQRPVRIRGESPVSVPAVAVANGPMRSCLNRPYAAAQLSHCWRSCAAQHSDLWVVGSADFPGIGQNSVLVVR